MMEFSVREARASDAGDIASYNAAMAVETEGKTLDPDVIGPGVARLFDDPSRGRYWVADAAGQVIGQLMITFEWSDWRNGNVWWIQSVYVHPEWRRKGVFSALYRHVQALAAADPDVIGIRLYVEENNTRAQQTYHALGMLHPNYLVMESMFDGTDTRSEE
jgi:ribosomal protein S18 acetylase RimI-like enzyme